MQRETRIAHYVVGVLTALSLVLLSLPLSSPVRAFKACASYVLDPLAFRGERGYQRIAEAPARARELLSADVENARLKDELRRTLWLKQTVESLSVENARLRRSLALKAPPLRHPVWAHVMERDPQRWYSSISIDAGRDRGLSLNDAVLGRRGDDLVAVGRVVEIRPHLATVLLLTDERSAVAAYLSSGTLEGLAQGQDGPHLHVNYLNAEARIVPNDTVYTSPTSATFPPDVLIGRVARVYPRDQFLAFQSVDVAPALDAAALQEVMILRAHPGTAVDDETAAPAPVPAPAETPRAEPAPRPRTVRRRAPRREAAVSTSTAAAAAPLAAPVRPSPEAPPAGETR
jgi:rod shape-determining protein MreC